MTINCAKLLSPTARTRLANTQFLVNALYHASNETLAKRLLHLARQLRADYPGELADPKSYVYDPNFVWHLVPNIAQRLIRLTPALERRPLALDQNEATRADIISLEGQNFRDCAGTYLQNLSIRTWPHTGPAQTPGAADLLAHEIANGNPVAFAIDRLYPPTTSSNDHIARSTREISRARHHDTTSLWTPGLMTRRRASSLSL